MINEKPKASMQMYETFSFKGLDLRDYFAAHAMNALISHNGLSSIAVDRAYKIADEMMAAREEYYKNAPQQ